MMRALQKPPRKDAGTFPSVAAEVVAFLATRPLLIANGNHDALATPAGITGDKQGQRDKRRDDEKAGSRTKGAGHRGADVL